LAGDDGVCVNGGRTGLAPDFELAINTPIQAASTFQISFQLDGLELLNGRGILQRGVLDPVTDEPAELLGTIFTPGGDVVIIHFDAREPFDPTDDVLVLQFPK